jgi:hypothetical protein
MRYKLLGVERSLGIYRNSDNGHELEIPLNLSFDQISSIVPPSEEDSFLYDGQELTTDQVNKFLPLIEHEIPLDFNKWFYVLECYGIYDWNASTED